MKTYFVFLFGYNSYFCKNEWFMIYFKAGMNLFLIYFNKPRNPTEIDLFTYRYPIEVKSISFFRAELQENCHQTDLPPNYVVKLGIFDEMQTQNFSYKSLISIQFNN